MYNRYVPQSDGSYHRSRMPEKVPTEKPAPPKPEPVVIQEPPKEAPKEIPKEKPKPQKPARPAPCCPKSAGSFLKGLLPKNMETEDLLVLLLLMLMAGDEGEDGSNMLLTLAIYLLL